MATGAEVAVTELKGTLEAAGPDYSIVTNGKSVSVRTRSAELQFKSANGIQTVRRFDQHLAIVEWQGPARVIDLAAGSAVFEATPEPESQFSQLHRTPGGRIVLTQHYFNQPILTDVRIYESASAATWRDATIGMSGNYAILSDGREVAYATRGLYDPSSGEKIGEF